MSFRPTRLAKVRSGIRDDCGPVECPSHRAFVRRHACAILGLFGHVCEGPMEAAHARTGTDGGTSQKSSDFWCLPLCQKAHRLQHAIGEIAFEAQFKISMKNIARAFAKISPHRTKWLSIGRDPEKEGTDRAPKSTWGKSAQ